MTMPGLSKALQHIELILMKTAIQSVFFDMENILQKAISNVVALAEKIAKICLKEL